MPYEKIGRTQIPVTSSQANHASSGISKPAVQPLQKVSAMLPSVPHQARAADVEAFSLNNSQTGAPVQERPAQQTWPAAQRIQHPFEHTSNTVQRVLYKGKKRQDFYVRAIKLGPYTNEEVRRYIDSSKHYYYDKKKKKIIKISKDKKKKVTEKKQKKKHGKMTGWMGEVDKGVKKYEGNLRIKYKARELKEQGSRGYKVGINNIAYLPDISETDDVEMTENQRKLNFLANHLRKEVVEEGILGNNKKGEDKKKRIKKRKKEFGPELQQIVGTGKKDGKTYYTGGGNNQESQEMLREELLNGQPNKKRRLIDYHEEKYRWPTIDGAVEQMRNVLESNGGIEKKLKQYIENGRSDEDIKAMLKSEINDSYKDELLKYLFSLRNSLTAKYGNNMLEDALIIVPDNNKEIHAESNLLNETIQDLELLDVMGTKVPCVACFAKYCEENQQSHLLKYVSSIWFSEPCMNQLGCDFSKQSAGEVVAYLNKIDQNLKNVVKKIKRYTGHMGDIKQTYNDDDSGSMGEESRQEIIDDYKSKVKKKNK